MKKWWKVIMILTASLCVLVGCGQKDSGKESGSGIKMYLTLSTSDTFRNTLVDEAKKKAKEIGAELVAKDAEGSLENQLEHIKEAVKGGYDVILCNPVDVDTTLQLQVTAGDLPIVFFNSCPNEERLEADKYVFAGSNEADAGKYQAEYILDKFADQDTINVAIFEGQKLHSATLGRSNALKGALEDSGKTINYVFDDYADWNKESAKEEFNILLKTGQKIDAVACNNDDMALGVIEACEENDIDPTTLPILGIDATEAGIEAIESGKMAFTVFQSAVGQGEYAVLAASRLAKGESLDGLKYLEPGNKYVYVPFEKVDSSNASKYK